MVTKDNILNFIRETLTNSVDPVITSNGKKYFKEKVEIYGVKVAEVTKMSKDYFEFINECTNSEIYLLCEQLLQSGFLEEQFIACNWSYYVCHKSEPDDFIIFENWLKLYVENWATCDTLCNHTIGTFIEKYPYSLTHITTNWTQSSNRWLRRAAAVTLIIPARKGMFFNEIIAIADELLTDSDDLVKKGCGWMLKSASEVYQKEIFSYVIKNKKRMARTILRYAIEKMPQELRKEAMKKDKQKGDI